jgi:hypothetical protein
VHKNPLNTASGLVAQFGSQAEMLAGEQMEAALASGNEEDFQYWSLVAKAVTLLTRPSPATAASKTPASTETRPTVLDNTIRVARRAAS